MPKMLNLDDIAPVEQRVLKFQGEEYVMEAPSVATFIRVTQDLEQMKVEEAGAVEQVRFMTRSITDAFPTMSQETVEGMNFSQISAIFNFIRDDAAVENEQAKKPRAKKSKAQ